MHLNYGAAEESVRRAAQIYNPNQRKPQHQMFSYVHRQLYETGPVTSTCLDRGGNR